MTKSTKTVRLDTLKNMHRIIAEKMVEVHGEYLCQIDGEKVRVIK